MHDGVSLHKVLDKVGNMQDRVSYHKGLDTAGDGRTELVSMRG